MDNLVPFCVIASCALSFNPIQSTHSVPVWRSLDQPPLAACRASFLSFTVKVSWISVYCYSLGSFSVFWLSVDCLAVSVFQFTTRLFFLPLVSRFGVFGDVRLGDFVVRLWRFGGSTRWRLVSHGATSNRRLLAGLRTGLEWRELIITLSSFSISLSVFN